MKVRNEKEEDRVEFSQDARREVPKEIKGRILLKNGQKLYAVSVATSKAELAEKQLGQYHLFTDEKDPDLVKFSSEYVFVPALNAATAEKKYKKNPNQETYTWKGRSAPEISGFL